MPTEFINTLKSTGGDYILMSTWESTTQADLTAATIKVFSHSGITGAIVNNASVTGATSGATGTVVGITTAGQILIDGITGTFQSAEAIEVDASNYVTTTDAGDSPIAVLECYGFDLTETNGVGIGGWTVDATNFTIIRAAGDGVHKGAFRADGGTGFRINASTGGGAIRAGQGYIVVEGIEVRSTSTLVALATASNTHTNIKYKNCLIEALSISTSIAAASIGDSGTLEGCIIVTSGRGIDLRSPTPTTMDNCTVIASGSATYGILTDSGVTLRNCVAVGFATEDVLGVPGTELNCATGDTSISGTGAVTGVVLTDGTDFVKPSTDNYRPVTTGKLYNAGTDLSGTFTDDIRGETYVQWSIGAFDTDTIFRTLKASLGDYSLISTWESTEQVDLVASGDKHVLECYNDWPSGLDDYMTLGGWTTGASNGITIRSAAGEGHDGVVGAGFFVSNVSTQREKALEIYQSYVTVQDISIVHNLGGGAGSKRGAIGFNTNSDFITIERVIIYTEATTIGASKPIAFTSAIGTSQIDIRNCVIDFSTITSGPETDYPTAFEAVRTTFLFQGDSRIHNNTFIGIETVVTTDGSSSGTYTNEFENNIFYGISALYGGNYVGSVTEIYDYNATNLASITEGTNWIYDLVDADFVDFAGGDYTPTSGGALAGAATDLSADFLDDITGTAR